LQGKGERTKKICGSERMEGKSEGKKSFPFLNIIKRQLPKCPPRNSLDNRKDSDPDNSS